MTLLDRLNVIPPKRCRAVARINGAPATHERLAAECGWSKAKLIAVSRMVAWDTLSLVDATTFARACGLDLHRLRSSFYHKSRRMKSLLKQLDARQRRMYAKLLG